MEQTPRSHSLVANGLTHHLLEWNAGGAATALLLHGFMDAAGTFDLLAPSLVEAGLRVLAPDMRGFGRGPRAPEGSYYYFTDYIADVAAVVREAVAESSPLFVVGHSMGGTIASYFTGAFPERVTKLALLEGVGPPDNPADVAPVRMRRWIADVEGARARGSNAKNMGSAEDALRRLVVNHPNVPIDVLRTRLPHLVLRDAEGNVSWAFDALHRTVSPVPFFAAVYKEFAKETKCPVLFVSGGPQGYHPNDEDERIASFPNATRAELPTAGHMMHWTQPTDLGRILVDFWRR